MYCHLFYGSQCIQDKCGKQLSQSVTIIATKYNYSCQMNSTYRSHWVGVSRQSFQTLAVLHVPDANTLIKLNSHNISVTM